MDDIKKLDEENLEIITRTHISRDQLLRQKEMFIDQIVSIQEELNKIDEKLGLFEKGE